ncbi:MAG: hypothetical protein OXC07_11605 [Kistimonas sp.]|nr:hypothetical protein [Kistimonas sp.]
MQRLVTLLLLSFTPWIALPAPAVNEAWYQQVWCDGIGGRTEAELDSGQRVDCLTETYAIEMDFAHKWTEAIGQSLQYALLTERKAGIVLILESAQDKRHLALARRVISHYKLPVTLWPLGP